MEDSLLSSSSLSDATSLETNDFDYVGKGGFVIIVQDEERLGVTKEQAELMIRNCPFFQKCLNIPGETEDNSTRNLMMKEAQNRIIHKPDWTLAIARHLVEVVTKGKTALPNLHLFEQLMAAGDQALLDLRLTSMVNYMDACSKDNNFLHLVHPSFYCFQFHGHVTSDQWLALLDRDILLYRNETNFVVQLYKDQALDREQALSRRKLDNRRSQFLVHAERSIDAILAIQKCLAGEDNASRDPAETSNSPTEAFSIYFETNESIPKDHHQLIDRLAGGEAYIRTCADFAEYQTEGYTVKASLDVLHRAIRPVQERSVLHCSFRIDNPTPDTLGRLINACRRAKIHPSTLGVDASINRYFCRKNMSDIKIILEYMADYSTTAKISGEFQLLEMSSEDQLF
jgi:hypothetical protein